MNKRINIFLIFLACFLSLNTSGQSIDTSSTVDSPRDSSIFSDKRFSLSVFYDSPFYFLYTPEWMSANTIRYSNAWNYIGGITIKKYLKNVTVLTGFSLSTMSYKHYLQTLSFSVQNKIHYFNVPFAIGIRVWNFYFDFQVSYSKPFKFNNTESNDLRKEINNLSFQPSPGGSGEPTYYPLEFRFLSSATLLAGVSYHQKLKKNININARIAYMRKSREDVLVFCGDIESEKSYLVEGKNCLSLGLELEYVINSK